MIKQSSTTSRRSTLARLAGGMLGTVGLLAGLLTLGAAPAAAQEASPPGFGGCATAPATLNQLERARIVDEKFSNNRYAEALYEIDGRYEHWRVDAATANVGRVSCKPKPINEQEKPRFGGGTGGSAGVGGGGYSFLGFTSYSINTGTVTVGSIETVQE